MNVSCVVLGGGGHARVLIDCLEASGQPLPIGVLDSDSSLWGGRLLEVPILGDDSLLPELVEQGVNCFVVGLGSIGDYQHRERLFELGLAHQLKALTVIHPRAICSRWAELGAGVQLLPGSVVNAGARIGNNVIINSGAIVEHDCVLEDHVHVATGARLASTVHVGKGAHIGAGATVRQCLKVGAEAMIGAGAVVVRDVPAHALVMGVPARPVKKRD